MNAGTRALGVFLFALLALDAVTHAAESQDANERTAILAQIDRLFAAIAERDRETLMSLTIPGSLNFSVADPVTGPADILMMSHSQFINNLSLDGPDMSGGYYDPTILIEGNIAVFWAPYRFFIEGQFDHCGIDSFQLVKRDGSWLISNISATRKYEGC